jgi:GNAT superfamily N-acetyltransferase
VLRENQARLNYRVASDAGVVTILVSLALTLALRYSHIINRASIGMIDNNITYEFVAKSTVDRLREIWGEKAYRHFHVAEGFMISAEADKKSIGLVSTYWRELPQPFVGLREVYIDFLEVHQEYRRQGIASRLVEQTLEKAFAGGAYQVRSWSSEDKLEALPMWKQLGFGLCPATTFPRGLEVQGFFVVKRLT